VPAAGFKVLIQPNGNVAIDVTDKVHPQVAAMAALAARVVGLDIAGIDLVTSDITRPLEERRRHHRSQRQPGFAGPPSLPWANRAMSAKPSSITCLANSMAACLSSASPASTAPP
jgi:hypothetical protein